MERAKDRSKVERAAEGELSDRELEQVTGGKFYKVATISVDGKHTWTVSTT